MHAHIEVIFRARTKHDARRTLETLLEESPSDWWVVGGRFRTIHDPKVGQDDQLEMLEALGITVTAGVRGRRLIGPFHIEHPTDILRLDDPRANAFLEEGRCSQVWWQKRRRLATPFDQKRLLADDFRSLRPADELPDALLAKVRRSPRGWWLATVDAHW